MIRFFSERRHALLVGLCCSVLLLSACSPGGDSIEERASTRWEILLNGDLAGAYEYLSPGYRSSVSSTQYQKSLLMNRVDWTSAKYIESECTGITCKVSISLGYALRGVLPGVKSFEGSQVVEESWLKSDNVWYLVPEQ